METIYTMPIHKVRKGELVRRKAGAKAVYIRGDYDRASKSFSLIAWDDASREIFVKRTASVVVGFTF